MVSCAIRKRWNRETCAARPRRSVTTGGSKRGNWASSLIWGRNHESHGGEIFNLNGYVAESTVNFLDRNYLYTRLELADKNQLLRDDDRARAGNHGPSSVVSHRRVHVWRRARYLEYRETLAGDRQRCYLLFQAVDSRFHLWYKSRVLENFPQTASAKMTMQWHARDSLKLLGEWQ